jgi:type IV pilus assembly protein PilW
MNSSTQQTVRCGNGRQSGFTLVELMIAMTVALFLLGGLMTIVQHTRQAYGDQNLLAQLQDNERLALTFMADVIESAGYYPDPKTNDPLVLMPIAGAFTAAGQPIVGTRNAAAPGDTVTVRYAAKINDNVFNCMGTQNTSGATDTFVNKFWVNNAPAVPQLTCTYSSTATAQVNVPLVSGVQNLQILYGVKTSVANTGSCTDTYMRANQMTTANWSAVCSIRVSLTFTNPLNPAGAGNQPITITRTIAVMSMAGVNT